MIGLSGLFVFGFFAGVKHAFDADHIAAVSSVASEQNSIKKSSLLGIFWGMGHALSLLAAGLIILLLRASVPEKLALSLELAVGIMLVILGVGMMAKIRKENLHLHRHSHGKSEHIHFHSHSLGSRHSHAHASFFIGLVHGLAGSAALALLVLATIDSLFAGLLYILIFSAGSIAGMMLVSSAISLPFILITGRLAGIHRLLKAGAGMISVLIGLTIIYGTAFAGGV